MFDVLVGSAPPPTLKPARLLTSVVAHTVVLVLLAEATRGADSVARRALGDTTLVFLTRLAPPAAPVPEARPPAPPLPLSIVVPVDPPPKGFQTVVAPEDIPTTIPPVDLSERPFDPRDYTGRGVEGGIGDGVIGGTAKVGPRERSADGDIIYTTTTDDARFQPAVLVSQPEPKYPLVLREIGLSGRVRLRFVVDTAGRVELPSIRVIESTHPEFESPARESVARAVFQPARMGARPVRQLAEQPIRFIVPQ